MSLLVKSFRAATIGLLFSTGVSGIANAVPSYGYSTLHFEQFTLTGIVGLDGQPLPGVKYNSSVTGTDGANYPGFASGGTSAPGTLFVGTDPAQAISGPGPFPVENTFSQALTASSGTRGDVQITGPIAGGATSNLVSEGNLTVQGSAGSNSGTSTTLNVTFTGASTVNLTFKASDILKSMVGTLGDSSNSQTSASFKIYDSTTNTYVTIIDNLNAANSGTTIAPFALNQNVASTNPSSPQSFTSSLTSYSYTANLNQNDNYQLTLADSTTVILSGSAPVPEPMSVALLGAGLLAMGLVGRARTR